MVGVGLSVHSAVSYAVRTVACARFTDGESEAQSEGLVRCPSGVASTQAGGVQACALNRGLLLLHVEGP